MNEGDRFADIRRQVTNRIDAVRIACELEAMAPKLGNVHPSASFADCNYDDFRAAAAEIAPLLGSDSQTMSLGDRVLLSVQATRRVTTANVNLGIILLIAPLAMADSAAAVGQVISSITSDDGRKAFEAIRLASPGGMKRADVASHQDVQTKKSGPIDLVAAMKQAAGRDRIALQYDTDFTDFFSKIVPVVAIELAKPVPVVEAIVNAQLQLLAADIDSLIARKCGLEVAEEARQRAVDCLHADSLASRREYDTWLRADGNRRNPGTTADLIAAALYWLLANA